MKSVIDESFYLNKLSTLVYEDSEHKLFEIKPELGNGSSVVLNIMDGLQVFLSEMNLSEELFKFKQQAKPLQNDVIKIDYCLDGEIRVIVPDDNVFYGKARYASYFAGKSNLNTMVPYVMPYKGISIMGYVSDIRDVFYKFFSSTEQFDYFINLIKEDKKPILIPFDYEIDRLINQIEKCFEEENYKLVKVYIMELLVYEMQHFYVRKVQEETYFKRSTVNTIIEIEKYISSNLAKKINAVAIAEDFDIDKNMLNRCFNHLYGSGVYEYIKAKRLLLAKELLQNTDMSITDIAVKCGYSNHSSFSKAVKQEYGYNPSSMRK